jgi:predicted RNase H-like nuclease
MQFVGLDGCRAGWVAVVVKTSSEFDIALFSRFADAVAACRKALVLVDIPIGLRDSGSAERSCDVAARAVLGPRKSSVFRAPVRAALTAPDYPSASAINSDKTRSDRVRGRRLSQQCFAILPKIREVDEYLSRRSSTRVAIREMHPEVCFWALNGGRPLKPKKTRLKGRTERLRILQAHVPALAAFIEARIRGFAHLGVGADDIMDAAVGAATGFLSRGAPRTFPADPERDRHGLAMEMVYWLAEGVSAAPAETQVEQRAASSIARQVGVLAMSDRQPKRKARGTTSVGYTNRNKQTVIRPTGLAGTDHGQSIYVLRCGSCAYEYGANGSDIFQRRCPKCQGGAAGLPYAGKELR